MGERRVLFESYWGKRMDCNPYALFKELSAIGGYECIWVLHDTAEDRSDFPYERVEPGSLRYLFALATSKYLISNANFPTEYDKRPGSVHLQTKHGTPLKVMGLDIRPVRPKEMDWSSFAARCQRWDYVISSNEYSSAVWRRGFPYNYKILETGYPRNDILFNATSDTIAGIRSKLGIAQGMKVALYAPTFRDRDRDAKEQVDFSDALDPKRVLEALGPDYVLLLRAHYLMEATGLQQDPRILDVSTYVDANEVCLISDLLITDYSSIMFDYANLGRPIVLFLHDYDDYMSGRGTYFDIRERAPGPVATTEDALCRALHHRAWESPYNVERLRKFRAEFCSFDDGKASARVLREVFGAGAKVSEKEG
jgi:CDP-glycerol glycerophosphotransferase (TagB/SpsB family)